NKNNKVSDISYFIFAFLNSAKSGDVCGAFHRIFVLNTLRSGVSDISYFIFAFLNSAKSGDVCGAFHRIFVLNTLRSGDFQM
ncbi:hypothetical protein, partial [Flavobacterium sp.]|uniref:hypothetical protein n=1 Tax=Flavobacterium sp. TaxID=239 RepID=UPI0037BF4577